MPKRNFIKKFLSINKIGIVSNKLLINRLSVSSRDSIILKLNNTNYSKKNEQIGYMHLMYENLGDHTDQKGTGCDVFVVDSPMYCKPLLQKLAGKNIGLEFLISKLIDKSIAPGCSVILSTFQIFLFDGTPF